MADRKALTDEQRKRLSWLRAMLSEAEQDAAHPVWDLFDSAWSLAYGTPDKTARVRACLEALRTRGAMQADDGYDPFASVLLVLRSIDRAFEGLAPEQAAKILRNADLSPREHEGGNGKAGARVALARMALACGALGCERNETPDQETVERVANRFKSANR